MPYRYESRDNPYADSIGALLARRGETEANAATRIAEARARAAQTIGNAQANAAQVRGQAWGHGLQSVGQTLANLPAQMQQQKRTEQNDKLTTLDIEARERSAAGEKASAAQDQAFFKMLDGGADPIEAAQRTYGPSERGANVLKGIAAFTELQQGPVKDARDTAGRLALGVKSLSPATQAQFWPQIRAASIKGGLGDEQSIPEQPMPEYLDAVIGWATGKEAPAPAAPKTREVKTRNADGSETIQIVEDVPGFSATSAAPKPTDFEWVTRAGKPLQIPKGTAQQGDIPYQPPSQAQGPQPGYQWVNRGGKPVYTNRPESGDEPLRAPQNTGDTAQDRQRNARTTAAKDFLTRLNELRTKINTKMGPSAGVTGMARRAGAAIGMDPDVAEYERIRAAGGRSLAVAIMGAQNLSDADASAWANMLPDARTDEETAKRLTTQVESMLNGMTGTGGPPSTIIAPKVGDVVTVNGKRVKISALHQDGTFDGEEVP